MYFVISDLCIVVRDVRKVRDGVVDIFYLSPI